MAATGFTPIKLYSSATASAVPLAANLATGELAINIVDGKLYYNDSGTVKLLASNASTTVVNTLSFGSTGLTPSTATSGAVTVAGTLAVANGGSGVTTSTGTTNVVLSNSPTLVTPALGTPSALVGTNITGTASGLTAGNVTTNANLTGAITSTGNATSLGSFTSAQLATALTDETGTGANVFATSPTLITPALGVATATSLQGIIGNVTPAAGSFTTVTASTPIGTASGGTGLGGATPFTANGVVFASSTSALATGSALTFDGTNLSGTGSIGTTIASKTAQFNAAGGSIYAQFEDGTNTWRLGAGIQAAGQFNLFDVTNSQMALTFVPGASGYTAFLQNNAERMRLTSAGLGIGTSSPGYKLQLSTDSAAKPGVGGLWTVVSDERIKANIAPANLDRCYEIVKSVPLKYFGFAPGVYTDDQIQDKNNLGWIAQDVQKVFKNAVSVKPFTLKTEIPDGTEKYEEQDFTLETVEKTETSIQVINGKPVQVSKVVTSENKVLLFDIMDVLDEDGNAVMEDYEVTPAISLIEATDEAKAVAAVPAVMGTRLVTYQMPRMVTKTRPKVRHDVIEDCLDLNGGQMIAALYGAVQALMVKVELLEARLATK